MLGSSLLTHTCYAKSRWSIDSFWLMMGMRPLYRLGWKWNGTVSWRPRFSSVLFFHNNNNWTDIKAVHLMSPPVELSPGSSEWSAQRCVCQIRARVFLLLFWSFVCVNMAEAERLNPRSGGNKELIVSASELRERERTSLCSHPLLVCIFSFSESAWMYAFIHPCTAASVILSLVLFTIEKVERTDTPWIPHCHELSCRERFKRPRQSRCGPLNSTCDVAWGHVRFVRLHLTGSYIFIYILFTISFNLSITPMTEEDRVMFNFTLNFLSSAAFLMQLLIIWAPGPLSRSQASQHLSSRGFRGTDVEKTQLVKFNTGVQATCRKETRHCETCWPGVTSVAICHCNWIIRIFLCCFSPPIRL